MKRVLALLLCLTLLHFMPVVHAESGVSFTMSDADIREDRLFDLTVYAQTDIPLSAALFSISYDQSLAEFRGVTAEKPFKTAFYDTGNEIRVSVLSADGVASDGNAALFSLKFKSLQAGSFSVDYTVSECVDHHAAYMPVGACTSGSVTITGDSAAQSTASSYVADSGAKNAKSNKTSGASAKSKPKSTAAADHTAEKEPTWKSLGTLSDVSRRDTTMPIERVAQIFALCGAVAVAALICFQLWRRKRPGKTPKK